jgi:ketosteroid isomerase-like protein
MRTLLGILCLSVVATFVLVAQDKSQSSQDEGKILALEAVWNRAEQSKDIAALAHIFAPSMIYVDYDGSIRTREQFLEYVKNDTNAPDQLTTEDAVPHSYGECIVVTGVYRGKWTKSGKPVVMRGRFVDTWVKLDGTWQCVASQATPIQH